MHEPFSGLVIQRPKAVHTNLPVHHWHLDEEPLSKPMALQLFEPETRVSTEALRETAESAVLEDADSPWSLVNHARNLSDLETGDDPQQNDFGLIARQRAHEKDRGLQAHGRLHLRLGVVGGRQPCELFRRNWLGRAPKDAAAPIHPPVASHGEHPSAELLLSAVEAPQRPGNVQPGLRREIFRTPRRQRLQELQQPRMKLDPELLNRPPFSPLSRPQYVREPTVAHQRKTVGAG